MNERKRVKCGKGYCALDYSMFFPHNQWHPSQIDPPVFETRAKSLKKKKGGEKNRDGKTGGIIGGGKVAQWVANFQAKCKCITQSQNQKKQKEHTGLPGSA
jgi:hypothetical protein